MDHLILKELYHDICFLTINRPEKRNALSPVLVERLRREIDEISLNEQIRMLILTGSGNAFCAGADLAYLQTISEFSEQENEQDSRNLADLFYQIYRLPKITIAMVNGPALAGGCGLALCCDYIFASSEKAKLGFTEVRIGFIPAIVMNFLIRRISLSRALHLAISGEILSAQAAHKIGLIYGVLADENLRKGTLDFAENLLEQNSFTAMIQTKELFQQLTERQIEDGLELASKVNAKSRRTADCQKGLKLFLSKQQQKWRDSI
ncbi:MAG: enoyl-CoA hydratase/isomerase family protein [bacterium]|nr:MAG: enoyl-CoA hydratase/isomerase family protein [bacterium]